MLGGAGASWSGCLLELVLVGAGASVLHYKSCYPQLYALSDVSEVLAVLLVPECIWERKDLYGTDLSALPPCNVTISYILAVKVSHE